MLQLHRQRFGLVLLSLVRVRQLVCRVQPEHRRVECGEGVEPVRHAARCRRVQPELGQLERGECRQPRGGARLCERALVRQQARDVHGVGLDAANLVPDMGPGRLEHRERCDLVGERPEHGRGCVRADRELGHVWGDDFRIAVLVEADFQRQHWQLEQRAQSIQLVTI